MKTIRQVLQGNVGKVWLPRGSSNRRVTPLPFHQGLRAVSRELKQQELRRLRKRHLNKKVNSRCLKLYRAYSISFNLSYVGEFVLQLNSEGLYQRSGKGKKSCCPVFPSLKKCEIRHFHVVVVQRRLRNVQKTVVQSCCFANLTYCLLVVPVAVAILVA